MYGTDADDAEYVLLLRVRNARMISIQKHTLAGTRLDDWSEVRSQLSAPRVVGKQTLL